MSEYIVDIHVGHGQSLDGTWDSGCTWKRETEAHLMLPIVKHAVACLRASGCKVYTDADTGNNKNMIADVREANKRHKAGTKHIYVSVHCDYSGAPKGVMPLYVSSTGKTLAKALNSAIKSNMGIKSRGVVKRSDLFELNSTSMTACVLETSAIYDPVLQNSKAYGESIAKGICNYFGIKYAKATQEAHNVATVTTHIAKTSLNSAQLKSLQKLLGVSQTGYIGGQDKALSVHYSGLYKVCKYDGGSGKSATVKALQKVLGVKVDGVLGEQTIKALQQFLNARQTQYKLKINGLFGDASTKALILYLSSKPKLTISKQKKVTKANTTKTSAKSLTRAKFLKALKDVADDCIDHKFVYSNKNSKLSYKSALKSNKRVNCARYVSWAMQRAGLLPTGKCIWLNRKINGNGASYIKKSKKVKITYPNKRPSKAGLVAGDICGFDAPHTMVTANSKGTSWYSAGGSDVKAHKYYFRRKAGYDNKPVRVKIRIK